MTDILKAMAESYRDAMNDWLQGDLLLSRESASKRAMAAALRKAAEMVEQNGAEIEAWIAAELCTIAEQAP